MNEFQLDTFKMDWERNWTTIADKKRNVNCLNYYMMLRFDYDIKRTSMVLSTRRDQVLEEDKYTNANGAFGASIYEPDEYYGYIL
jgi:hypothetical protein